MSTSTRQPEQLSDDRRVDLDDEVVRKAPGRLRSWLHPASYVPTYVGILLTLVGFGLIAIAWAKVAGLTDVWQQMPYLLSAGFPGLGLVMTGLLVINIAAKRQDAAERARQLDSLTEALQDLNRTLGRG